MTTAITLHAAPLTTAPATNPALVYLASLAPSSRRTMGRSLTVIAEILGFDDFAGVPWGALRYEHTQAIRARLAERCSHVTANRHLSALRGTLKEAWRLGYMSAEDHSRAVDLKPIRGQKVMQAESGRHLASGEIKALIDACPPESAAGRRDAAIVAVGYGCGLRRAELARLELADYRPEPGALLVRHGKGNKERLVYLPAGAHAALRAWLTRRGAEPGPLFVAVRKGDHLTDRALTDQAIYYILQKRQQEAGLRHFTPHDLRRTLCKPGMVTHPKLDAFQSAIGADVWHHIAVPPMSTEEFYQLIGQVHTYIQVLLDKRKEELSKSAIS